MSVLMCVGFSASLVGGIGQSAVWFTVGAGLLLGVVLQIAATIVALYLIVSTIGAPRSARHHRSWGMLGGLHGHHGPRLAPS